MQYKMPNAFLVNLLLVLMFNLFKCDDNDVTSQDSEELGSNENRTCFKDFGCFSRTYPWNSPARPITYLPEPPEKVNPTYCLYTRINPETCDQLEIGNRVSLLLSSFVADAQVYFIAHGFVENGQKEWVKNLTAGLLRRTPANVIVIDWSGGSDPPYAQAVANTRLVGVMTGHLILEMREALNLVTDRMHVIGHSLGAHLSSYIGNYLKLHGLVLGRISGLDPAEPHFAGTDPMVRLDPGDAVFVDVIHTDANPFYRGGLGIIQPVGHVDFYVNGGRDQPGCEKTFMREVNSGHRSLFNAVKKALGCNHISSYKYYIETVTSPEKYLAIECRSWEDYMNGSCFQCIDPRIKLGHQCAYFGFHSIKSFPGHRGEKPNNDIMLKHAPKRRHVTMYLITGGESPYLRSQYRVRWKIWDHSHEYGKFSLNIDGTKGSTGAIELKDKVIHFNSGSEHTTVVGGASVGRIKSATLTWSYKTSFINFFSWRVNLTPMAIKFITISSLESEETLTFCLPKNKTLISDVPEKLILCGLA